MIILIQGGEQASQPSFHRAQIGDLVNFNLGVDFPLRFQDIPNLVGGDRVHAASEGIPAALDSYGADPSDNGLRRKAGNDMSTDSEPPYGISSLWS